MKRSRYTEEQIAFALRQAEGGTSVGEVCRKMGISENTFYRWKRKFFGMGVVELRRLRQLDVVPTDVVYSLETGTAPPMPPCGRLRL